MRDVGIVSIVDDDVSFLRALQFLLRSAGFSVGAFCSAEEFLRTASDTQARCLVLDVQLGAQTGFDVHEGLAAAGWRIPTIFMTAHDDAPTRERARHLGAVAYLRKPFDDAALLAAVAEALGSGDTERSQPPPTTRPTPAPPAAPRASSVHDPRWPSPRSDRRGPARSID